MKVTWATRAAAKLNLTLEVLGKRADGFHNLESLAVSLDLVDDVRLRRTEAHREVVYRDERGRRVSIETEDDIVQRAWSALAARCELGGGAQVEVVKRIPLTSGLGGGSTDAAAFLRLARAAWDLPLSDAELAAVGAQVGSDVPICLAGGAARMSGRGERVELLAPSAGWFEGWAVLLHRAEIPVPALKTAAMYRTLRSSDFRDGSATDALWQAAVQGVPPTMPDCVNSFDQPAREVMQGLLPARRRLGAAVAAACLAAGQEPLVPLLAGAGPTLFALLPPGVADSAAVRLQGAGGFTATARPLPRPEAVAVWRAEQG